MLVEFIVAIIMSAGLVSTLFKKLSGSVIILFGAAIYGAFTGFVTFSPAIILSLVCLVLMAEVGGRGLRVYLTQNFKVTRTYSIDTTVTHFAALVASDALLGPILGLVLWQLVAGKNLLPRVDTVHPVLVRLAGVALFRFVCGLVMIVIISSYIML